MRNIIIFLFITISLFSENIYYDNTQDYIDFLRKFEIRYPKEMFDPTEDFYKYAWAHFIKEINDLDYSYRKTIERTDLIQGNRIDIYFKENGGNWINIKKHKIYRRDGTYFYHPQVYEISFIDNSYQDDYRKNKIGFKIFGSYYMFNKDDYYAMRKIEFCGNSFECIVFTIGSDGKIRRNEFGDMVKTWADKNLHIVIDYYKMDNFYNKVDLTGKHIFSVIIGRNNGN